MSLVMLDPSHEGEAFAFTPAPRLASLRGCTVGIVSNGKEGTQGLFGHLARLLRERHGVSAVDVRVKSSYSAPADPEIMAAAARWDLAVTGIGD